MNPYEDPEEGWYPDPVFRQAHLYLPVKRCRCYLCQRSRERMMALKTTTSKKVTVPRISGWMICQKPNTGQYSQNPNPKKLYPTRAMAERDAATMSAAQKVPFYLLEVVAEVRPIAVVPPVEWIKKR